MRIAVQVGTNNSNDAFLSMCQLTRFDKIYLIEPHTRFNKIIKKTYKDFDIEIINIAITSDQNIKETKLYSLNEEGTHDSLSLRKSHPIRMERRDVNFVVVPCMTLMNFCKLKDIMEIDFLCIDTEGLDDEILMSIDLEAVPVKRIMWENWDHDDDDENGKYRTGSIIKDQVRNKLLSLGYIISNYDSSNLYAYKRGEYVEY
jgi:FkbM family methyltransferase